MKFDFEVPGFTGFYHGLWDQGENEYNAITCLQDSDDPDIRSLHYIEDWGFCSDYREKVAQMFAEEYVDIINRHFGLDLELAGSYVQSPKEYNFRTDKIYVTIAIPNYEALVKQLSSLASDPKYRSTIAKTIKDNHTSRDGFWSWMSNDIEEWFGLMMDPDNSHYTSYFIGYLLDAMCPDEIENLNEVIYEYVSQNTDLHSVMPLTDDAKDEWGIYQKYGNIYTEFAETHPIRYPNPHNPNCFYTEDWCDYKEDFLEIAREYEQEQKRQAAIAAYPTIPGLIDDETTIPTA